jgi:hypothetical protein
MYKIVDRKDQMLVHSTGYKTFKEAQEKIEVGDCLYNWPNKRANFKVIEYTVLNRIVE